MCMPRCGHPFRLSLQMTATSPDILLQLHERPQERTALLTPAPHFPVHSSRGVPCPGWTIASSSGCIRDSPEGTLLKQPFSPAPPQCPISLIDPSLSALSEVRQGFWIQRSACGTLACLHLKHRFGGCLLIRNFSITERTNNSRRFSSSFPKSLDFVRLA